MLRLARALSLAQSLALSTVLALPLSAQTAEEVAAARLVYLDGDYATALAVLRPAAEAGDPVAQNIVADAYDDGTGYDQDFAAALDWYARAAAQDFDKAVYNLGVFWAQGRDGYPADAEKAAAYYDRAIELGYPFAMNNRATMYEAAEEMEKAVELYRRAADLDHGQSIANLASLYIRGDGVDEDLSRALELYRRGAALGDRQAINGLGAMYYNGYGVTQDGFAAHALYRMAAEKGHHTAALNLAYDYIEGVGPEAAWKDPARAWAWCLLAQEWARDGADYTEDCDYLAGQIDDAAKAEGVALMPSLRP